MGTANADTISAIAQASATADTGTLNSADILDGGAGVDTLNIRATTLGAATTWVPALSNIENIAVTNVDTSTNLATFSLGASGATNYSLKGTVAAAKTFITGTPTAASITLDAAKTTAAAGIQSVNLGSATGRTGTADAFTLNVANGSGAATTNNAFTNSTILNMVTSAAGGATADNTFEVANIVGSGAASYVTFQAGLDGVRTVNYSGNATANTAGYGLVINQDNGFASLRKIDASAATGGGINIATSSTNAKTVIGSGSNDRVWFTGGVAQINTATDAMSFGAGTDTLAFGTDTTTGGYTAAQLAYINAISDLERIEFTSSTPGAIDASLFTVAKGFVFSTAETAQTLLDFTGGSANTVYLAASHAATIAAGANGSAGTAANGSGANGGSAATGTNALKFTGSVVGSTENLQLAGGVTVQHSGGAGGVGGAATAAGSGAGGAGGNASAGKYAIDFGAGVTKLAIESIGTSANSILGGNGGSGGAGGAAGATGIGGNGGNAGAGAEAINNSTQVQSVTITGTRDLTIQGGSAGTAGAAGASGASAGTAGASAADAKAGFTGAVNVDSSTFTGKLTINLSTGADALTMGSGGGVIRTMGGADTVTLGAGIDKIDLRVAADTTWNTTGLTLTGFTSGQDKVVVATLPTLVKTGGSYTANGTGVVVTDIGNAITAGGGLGGANNAAVVTITGSSSAGTYLVIDTNGSNTYSNADAVIKLVGTTTIAIGDFTVDAT